MSGDGKEVVLAIIASVFTAVVLGVTLTAAVWSGEASATCWHRGLKYTDYHLDEGRLVAVCVSPTKEITYITVW